MTNAQITTAAELDALPTHATVTDNQGTQWKKFWGRHGDTFSFRCLGGYNRDRKSSAWLAQYAPLTRVPDDETESAATQPTAADPSRLRRALALLRTGADPVAAAHLDAAAADLDTRVSAARIEHRADCLIYQNTTARELANLCDAVDTARAGSLLFA